MKKCEVVNMYEMEELLPLVKKMVAKYTSNESSSVTYEKARQLMGAIIYSIEHFEVGERNLITSNVLPVEEVYRRGFEAVVEKVIKTKEKYNDLMGFFDHYENRNYRDTVEKAIPGFFIHYDARFAPTENIITMDYPIFNLDMELEGIDMIAQYIDAIYKEQLFLMKFPREYVISELRSFHPAYENEFFNIKEILELQMSKD